ncbi:MAG: hypothetical protein UH678_00755 [Fibrobacteraceae bacterium]|nr:hypothetical protein [Fibrobacteraceae bacterium]
MVEAISLQATLVFGLLRYVRNDKNSRLPHYVRDDNSQYSRQTGRFCAYMCGWAISTATPSVVSRSYKTNEKKR